MHIMAYILRDALVLLSLDTQSLAQQDDPVKGFCRRWGMQRHGLTRCCTLMVAW